MKDIFENVKFGDKFLTRGGKVAVFLHKVGTNGYLDDDKRFYRFGSELETFTVNENGMYHNDSSEKDCLDIVSKYEEPLSDTDIDKVCNWLTKYLYDYLCCDGAMEQYYIADAELITDFRKTINIKL